MWFPVVDSIDVLLSTVKDRYIGLKSPYSHFFFIKYRVVFNGLTHSHAFHREECDLGVSGLWIMGGIETFSGRIEKTGGMRGWETDDKLKALRGSALGKGGGQGLLGSDRGHKVISLLRKELAELKADQGVLWRRFCFPFWSLGALILAHIWTQILSVHTCTLL